MTRTAWVVLVAVGIYLLHRVALRMEAKGWIYYQKKRGSSGALSSAALELQSTCSSRASAMYSRSGGGRTSRSPRLAIRHRGRSAGGFRPRRSRDKRIRPTDEPTRTRLRNLFCGGALRPARQA